MNKKPIVCLYKISLNYVVADPKINSALPCLYLYQSVKMFPKIKLLTKLFR